MRMQHTIGESVMKLSSCPHMDVLGRELIEAYRRSGDQEASTIVDSEFRAVQGRMAAHRPTCVICQQIGRGKYPRQR